jgi:hypothetical protein
LFTFQDFFNIYILNIYILIIFTEFDPLYQILRQIRQLLIIYKALNNKEL